MTVQDFRSRVRDWIRFAPIAPVASIIASFVTSSRDIEELELKCHEYVKGNSLRKALTQEFDLLKLEIKLFKKSLLHNPNNENIRENAVLTQNKLLQDSLNDVWLPLGKLQTTKVNEKSILEYLKKNKFIVYEINSFPRYVEISAYSEDFFEDTPVSQEIPLYTFNIQDDEITNFQRVD